MHLPAVQVGAAFHEHQTKSRARSSPYVAAAMKGFERLLLILLMSNKLLKAKTFAEATRSRFTMGVYGLDSRSEPNEEGRRR